MAEDSELELKFIDSIKTVARTNKWDFEKVPDADSYRYELRIMDGENDIKYYIIPQFALGGHYGVKHYTVADFQIICMSARINGNDFKEIDKLPMWAIFLDGYTYHAQAPNMRFYGDKEKRDGIRDSKTHRIFSWTMTWEDIQLFENDKEDSLGLNSITRLIEFLKNPQMGYIRETAFGCIADAENFMGHGGALYQGEITIDESCYDELTDFSTDEKVAEEIDKGISYNWNLQQIYPDIDKDEWIGFWRRYNLLQFFSNTTKVEPVIDADMVSVDRDEIKMYYPGLEHIVDILLDHKIPFGTDGDVDLTDSDGIVLASAGMIIRDLKIVIDPADDNSESIFEAAGFKIFTAENFDINEITTYKIMRLFLSDTCYESLFDLPKRIQTKVVNFQKKFRECTTSNGMHLEPIAQFNDSSMRTARIDDNYRAVIGIIDNNAYLLFVGTHEVAYNWGIRKRLVWNDHTQACQLVSVQQTTEPIAEKTETESMTSSDSVFKDISKEQILKIGVPEDLIPTVMKITSLDDLDPLEDCLPSDAYENIFNLLDGVSINDIIAEIEEGQAKENEDQLLSNNNKRRFVELTDDEALQRILDNDMEKWQIFLHPSQQKLVNADYKGTIKVSGGAGTGKTVAALHRLKFFECQS